MKMNSSKKSKKNQRSSHQKTKSSAFKLKKILVPIDFSANSNQALSSAVTLAKEFGSKISLLNVLESPSVFFTDVSPDIMRQVKQVTTAAKNRLSELAKKNIKDSIPVETEIRTGRAYQEICETAKKQKADLITIGTRGLKGLKHLLLGSTAEQVIHHAPCSVVVVHGKKEGKTKFVFKPSRILVPTDFSEPAEQAFQVAVALARQYRAQLHLLYVVPMHYAVGDYDMIDYGILAAEQKEEGQKQLAALNKDLGTQNILTSSSVRYGRPATEIIEAAKELRSDLILISTHGRTGWKEALLGSTTSEVVRHAECPIFVVRSPQK